jgi:K+ transporter
LSNTELAFLVISTVVISVLGKEAYITALGYMGPTSLKTSHPCGLPL